MKFQDLRDRIREAHTYLLHEPQNFYLRYLRSQQNGGVWLITNNPDGGARLFGRFNDEVPLKDFAEAVYCVLNEMRPG